MPREESSEEIQRTTLTLDVEYLEEEEQERRYGKPDGNAVHEFTVDGRASHLVITRPGEEIPFHACVPADYDGEETLFRFDKRAFDHVEEGDTERVQIEVFTVAR